MQSLQDVVTLTILFFSLYFEMFMFFAYMEKRSLLQSLKKRSTADQDNIPGVTIIVPCYNEQHTARKTIESLLSLSYPKDKLHIFAVNDGSTDSTPQTLDTYRNHPQITVIHKENGGKHTALNLGIKQATTEFVGCLDADSYVKEDALLRVIHQFNDPEVMAVVPSLHIFEPKTLVQRMQKTEYLIGVFLRSVLAELKALYVTPGPFSIFRKSVFEQIGYYKKAHNTEDMEMALRMQSHGLKIASAHDAVVYTSSPRTARTLYKQRVRWTSGFLHNLKDYRSMLLNSSYGHLGGFVLPMMVISAFSVIAVVALFGYDIVHTVGVYINHFNAIGFNMFELSWPSFNWYFMHTSPIFFTGIVAFSLVITFIVIGTSLSKGNKPQLFDIACYISIYSFIAPIWIIKSVSNVVLSKQAVWR